MRLARLRSANPVEAMENRRLLSVVYPSDLEQYMVEVINHARANPAAEAQLYGIDLNEGLSPGTISSAAKQPLAISPILESSASSHTQEMLQTQAFSHAGADGSSPYDRELAAGYVFNGSWGWGENIAYQSDSPGTASSEAAAELEEQDLFVDTSEADRGHRLNLLNPAFKEIGAGMQDGIFNGANVLMTTEDLANTSGNSFLTGVVFADSNRNGSYDPGEGLAGTAITAVQQGGSGTVGSTVSWSSGGYTLQLAPGTYNVTASGGSLAAPIVYKNVTIGSANIEIDFDPATSTPAPAPTPTPTPTPTPAPTPTPPPTSTSTSTPSASPTATPSNPAANGPGSTTSPASAALPPVVGGKASGVIDGRIYEDINDDGRADPGEIGAPYMTVFLDTQGTAVPNPGEPTSTTNTLGEFQFIGVSPGKYHVVVVLPTGWRISTGTLDNHGVVVHKGHSVARAATFFITPTVFLSGTLFNDLAGSGSRSANDPGISGWTVYLDLNGDAIRQASERATTTGHGGTWSFGDLSPGTYTIRVVLHKHFVLSTTTLVAGPLSDGQASDDNLIGVHRM